MFLQKTLFIFISFLLEEFLGVESLPTTAPFQSQVSAVNPEIEASSIASTLAARGTSDATVTYVEVCGTSHGRQFDDWEVSIKQGRRIKEIALWSSGEGSEHFISSIKITYQKDHMEDIAFMHGKPDEGPNPQRLFLEKNEYISAIQVHCGSIQLHWHTTQHTRVAYMKITKNNGDSIERGQFRDGIAHYDWGCANCRLAGFMGHSGAAIDALASRWVPLSIRGRESNSPEEVSEPTNLQARKLNELITDAVKVNKDGALSTDTLGVKSPVLWHKPDLRSEENQREFGPSGGDHGIPWTDKSYVYTQHRRIASISMWCGARVDAIEFSYRNNKYPLMKESFKRSDIHGRNSGPVHMTPWAKAPPGATDTFELAADEYIVSVEVDPVRWDRGVTRVQHTRVSYIKFTTNKNHSISCGRQNTSQNMAIWQSHGYALLYCSGKSGAAIDEIKGYFIPVTQYF